VLETVAVYNVVLTADIRENRMSRRLEKNAEEGVGWRSVVAGGRCQGVDP
jgi:hypothetical protein